MAELLIAGIKACDSMKKAFARLDAAGVAYTFQDFKKVPPDAGHLERWLTAAGPELVNRKGTTWRQLDDAGKARAETPEGLIALLQEKPSLIKRPLLSDGTLTTVGLDSPLLP